MTLNFDSVEERDIALKCMDRVPLLAHRMRVENPSHLEVLKMWVTRKFENLLILAPEQRCAELVNIYLEQKFKTQLTQGNGTDPVLTKTISLLYSYTKQLIIEYNYKTKEGEVVSYFDSTLNIPVKLTTNANVKFKLIDGLEFVKNLDIELNYVDLHTTVSLLNDLIVDSLRSSLLDIIGKKNVSYYDLPRHYDAIKRAMLQKLASPAAKYGLQVTSIKLNDISLIDRIDEQLEKQYYALATQAQVKQFEYRMEEESLRLYEKKAGIHAAYPDFEPGLTEAEKDFALERYLKRKDKSKNLEVKVDTQKIDQRLVEHTKTATTVSIAKPEPPKPPVKRNKWRVLFAVLAVLWLVPTVLTFVFNLNYVAIPLLIVGVLGLVALGITKRYQLRYGLTQKEKTEYDKAYQVYEKLLAEYKAYNQQGAKLNGTASDAASDKSSAATDAKEEPEPTEPTKTEE